MTTLFGYTVITTICLLSATLYYAYYTRQQFYPAVIYLTSSPLPLLVLGHASTVAVMITYKLYVWIFLGSLNPLEVQAVRDMAVHALIETCLALTIFRSELGPRVFALFSALMFVKVFHWIATPRVESLGWQDSISKLAKLRLAIFLFSLASLDLWASWQCINSVLKSGPSVLVLFAFEFSILFVSAINEILKFNLALLDVQSGRPWEARPVVSFYIELAVDFARLFLVGAFFIVMAIYFGLPLHLIRELYMSAHTLKQRITRYLMYRRMVRNLHDRFPYGTEQELDAAGRQCIICREDMDSAKKLPCGHLFHFNCLRNWMERSNTCPVCRAAIPTDTPIVPVVPAAPQPLNLNHLAQFLQQQRHQPAAPAAPQAAAPQAAPPAPVEDPLLTDFMARLATMQSGDTKTEEEVKFDSSNPIELLQRQTLFLESQMEFHRNALRFLHKQYDEVIQLQRHLSNLTPPQQ